MKAGPKARTVPREGIEREEKSLVPRKTAIASGESRGREPAGWDESGIGAARNDAPVDVCATTEPLRHNGLMRTDLICRTAVYVTRSYGGVGGGGREAFPYPDSATIRSGTGIVKRR